MSKRDILQELSSVLALSQIELIQLIAKAPHSYKIYEINKRAGGKRKIAQPARQTKYLQKILIDGIFQILPVHQCATAYKQGASVKRNAEAHKDKKYLAKFDIVDFFGSIKSKDLIKHFVHHLSDQLPREHCSLVSRLCCIVYKGTSDLVLSVGAPSSPVLSNSIMYAFDCSMHEWCESNGVTYTRYADDLTFSTNIKDKCFEIEAVINGLLGAIEYPALELNRKKTVYISKKNQRRITGVVVNSEGALSLGRERKRLISVMIHKYSLGELSKEEVPHLQGLLGFAEDVEPTFTYKMKTKYGVKVISELFQFRAPPKKVK